MLIFWTDGPKHIFRSEGRIFLTEQSSSGPKAKDEQDAGEASQAEPREDTREEPFEAEAGRGDGLLLQFPVQARHLLHRTLQAAIGTQQALPLLRLLLLPPLLQLHGIHLPGE